MNPGGSEDMSDSVGKLANSGESRIDSYGTTIIGQVTRKEVTMMSNRQPGSACIQSPYGPLYQIWVPGALLELGFPELVKGASMRGHRLSFEEADTLWELATGKTNSALVVACNLADEKSVKARVSAILRKMNAANRTEAVAIAQSYGFCPFSTIVREGHPKFP